MWFWDNVLCGQQGMTSQRPLVRRSELASWHSVRLTGVGEVREIRYRSLLIISDIPPPRERLVSIEQTEENAELKYRYLY